MKRMTKIYLQRLLVLMVSLPLVLVQIKCKLLLVDSVLVEVYRCCSMFECGYYFVESYINFLPTSRGCGILHRMAVLKCFRYTYYRYWSLSFHFSRNELACSFLVGYL
uniref:Uncharacterized protein n=1 Tax=Picea sitchensis TaxID=3332 RepID=D5AAI6_PICSI|nr:unknown [Picea sitchensis]